MNKYLDIKKLESILMYEFKDKEFLHSALSHISYLNETKTPPKYSFRKLEFVGDAVLEIVIRKFIFVNYKDTPLQQMFYDKIKIVNNKMLAKLGNTIKLYNFVILGKGEAKKKKVEASIIADVFEAISGAIFLDSKKISPVEGFLFAHFNDIIRKELKT